MTKTSLPKRAGRQVLPRDLAALKPVVIGCTVLMLATGAQAQDTQTQKLDTVTVTGIRKGIEDAISVKKNSDSIVEAISAEDIGKLPDTSIAESIARLPGVAAQRVNGRASAISVRGFSPDFATSLLNGREQVSTGDSRYVEYDQYPSELLSGVTIYKTPDGGLVGQGLSATVNMETARPLNFSKRTVAINYRDEKLGKGLDTPAGSGYRANVAYIDQFADRTIGIAIGLARLKENTGTTQNSGSWGTTTVGGVTVPGGLNDLVDTATQKRDAVMATLQYKPSKSFNSTLDVFATKFDQTQLEQGVQLPMAFGQNYMGATVTPTTVTNGVATAGSIPGIKALSRNDVNAFHDKVRSIGWNNQLDVGDWKGTLDLATSDAKRRAPHLETTAGLPGDCKANPALCGTLTWTGFDGTNVLGAKYTLPYDLSDATKMKLTDVEGWGGGASLPQAGYTKTANTEDKLNAFRLSAKRNLGEGMFFSDLDFGVNYADRKKERTYVEGRLIIAGSSDPYAGANVPGGTKAIGPATGIPYLAWDPDGSIGSVYSIAPKLVPDIANKNWTVSEKVTTGYVKSNIDSSIGDMPLRGNAGLQIVRTEQSSTAFNADAASCPGDLCNFTTTTNGKTYYDVLPSLNLVGDLGNGNTLRLGLARQMARPTLDDMRASLEFSVDNTSNPARLSGSGGNPQLKPFRADALDLSYEKYWGNKAYVSAAFFYKKLSTYIVRTPSTFDYSPYVTANTALPPNGSKVGILTAPLNGSGGNINGIELSASLPLNVLASWLDGFGVQANFASNHSSISLPTSGFNNNITTPTIPLPGLSKRTEGWALYFEKWGFEARVGQRYRSDFVGNITDQYGDSQLVYIKNERITDAQISYEFRDGWLKGLSLLAQANNLNNAPYVEYKQSPNDPSVNRKYGKTYLMGANYKF